MVDTLHLRHSDMLQSAFGASLIAAFADADVIEIMVNPDGRLWLDRLSSGREATDICMPTAQTERIIRLVASQSRTEVHRDAPLISSEIGNFSGTGNAARFEGLLPPIAVGPCFAIRKPASLVYRLSDYVGSGMLSHEHAAYLRAAVRNRMNILVAGGTSSGKTTFVNALLAEMADLDERIILIEDTRELCCSASDTVQLKTRPGVTTIADLVRSTLRLRPDRIIIGEVRGSEALDMLKAWNTGHPGGVATVHANDALSALYRLEQLVQEIVVNVPRPLIAETVDLIIFLSGRGSARKVTAICAVDGLDRAGGYRLKPLMPSPSTGE